jgi:hypothetical protein
MMSATHLEHEVGLLLAKYGKKAVLDALATKVQLPHEELESLLKRMPSKKSRAHSRKTPIASESMDDLIREHPAKTPFLRTLHGRFQNRTFLPELRDVRRFFEQHSRTLGAAKSRTESFRRLFKLLAELDVPELDSLCQAEPPLSYSSLGIISDAILGRNRAAATGAYAS